MVKREEMEKFWRKLSLAYVTEKSDDLDNPNGISNTSCSGVPKVGYCIL